MSSKNFSIARATLGLIVALSLHGAAYASGTYTGRPPRPPTSVDRAAYALGKQVFAGEFTPSAGNAETQASQLLALYKKLPKKANARHDITEYAGKLSDEQMDALRYFLLKRYKAK